LGYKHFAHFNKEQSVCQMVSRMLTPELHEFLKNFSKDTDMTEQFLNLLFRMKRGSTTSMPSQNKACNGTNESVKIVILFHFVILFFCM